jgi:hypothetical protein
MPEAIMDKDQEKKKKKKRFGFIGNILRQIRYLIPRYFV